jgi:predicted transposase YbfD/YdcC
MEEFRTIFGELEDPRDFNVWHDLFEVLFIAVAACLCGANSYAAMAEFGRAKEPLLRRFLVLKHGIPSRHTFERVFRHLNPEGLEAALVRFTRALGAARGHTTAGQVVAMDGKRLRGAYDQGLAHQSPIMVCAYLQQTRLVLGQRQATDCREAKGLRQLLEMVALEGAIVTGDALYCSRTAAQTVRTQQADYVFTLKGNRSSLAQDAAALFAQKGARAPAVETLDQAHGRTERRRAQVIRAPGLAQRHRFADLAAFGRIEAWRTQNGETRQSVRTFVLSKALTPAQLLATVREHWTIENGVHWRLDVLFQEDLCRTRKDHGPANLAVLRKITLNLLQTHPSKSSINLKRQRAGWDETFFLELLTPVTGGSTHVS